MTTVRTLEEISPNAMKEKIKIFNKMMKKLFDHFKQMANADEVIIPGNTQFGELTIINLNPLDPAINTMASMGIEEAKDGFYVIKVWPNPIYDVMGLAKSKSVLILRPKKFYKGYYAKVEGRKKKVLQFGIEIYLKQNMDACDQIFRNAIPSILKRANELCVLYEGAYTQLREPFYEPEEAAVAAK